MVREARITLALVDAALDGNVEVALNEVAGQIRDVRGLQLFRVRPAAVDHCGTVRVRDDLIKRLCAEYTVPAGNPVVERLPALPRARMTLCRAIVGRRAYEQSPVFSGFVVPAKVYDSAVSVHDGLTGTYMVSLGISRRAAWLDDAERAAVDAVVTAFVRAVDMGLKEHLTAGATSGHPLDGLFVDARARPIGSNDDRRAILRAGSLFVLAGGAVSLAGPAAMTFDEALAAAIGGQASAFIAQDAASGPVEVQVRPGPALPFGPTARIGVRRLGPAAWDRRALGLVFGLTAREADVAAGLAAGRTSRELSDELSLTAETVRTYLRRIYAKTGTSTQSQLAALIATGRPA